MSLIDQDSAFESTNSPLLKRKKGDSSYNPEDGTTRLPHTKSSMDEEITHFADHESFTPAKYQAKHLITCCLCCVLILTGASFTTFYLYPRYPDIQVHPEVQVKSFQWNQSSFHIDLVVPVFVQNDNYVECDFHFPLCDLFYGGQVVGSVVEGEKKFKLSSGVSQTMRVETATLSAFTNFSEVVNQLNLDCQFPANNVTMNISLKVGFKCIVKTLSVSTDSTIVVPCS